MPVQTRLDAEQLVFLWRPHHVSGRPPASGYVCAHVRVLVCKRVHVYMSVTRPSAGMH